MKRDSVRLDKFYIQYHSGRQNIPRMLFIFAASLTKFPFRLNATQMHTIRKYNTPAITPSPCAIFPIRKTQFLHRLLLLVVNIYHLNPKLPNFLQIVKTPFNSETHLNYPLTSTSTRIKP
jgi:hypothetical protein